MATLSPSELTDSERATMLGLLEYPNCEGLHPNEARWRNLARELRQRLDSEYKRADGLQSINATLAAEIDRQRPVITAVHGYCQSDQYGWDNRATLWVLRDAYRAYESSGGKDRVDES